MSRRELTHQTSRISKSTVLVFSNHTVIGGLYVSPLYSAYGIAEGTVLQDRQR
jgi:hypothetical protein